MKLSQFRFKLPEENISLQPTLHRDECRMMVLHRRSGQIDCYKPGGEPDKDEDGAKDPQWILFRDIINYFGEGDTFIFNDTKVIPARLYCKKEKTDAKIEVFLLRELNADHRLWDVLVEPARKIRISNKLFFNDNGSIVAEVVDNTTSRGRTLRFLYDCPHEEFRHELFALGEAPLPKYIISRRKVVMPDDMNNFQTIYAKNGGAVTAPSTGLHFSRELMKRMEIRGIAEAFITIHSSLGNFDEIEVEDLTKYKVSSEEIHISGAACAIVNSSKQAGHHLCLIGVSTARATESAVGTDGLLKPYDGWTNKFITPPYKFGLADSMVTNFYGPKSPMMMTTCAFGGYDNVMECYRKAVSLGYKFGCFGDALLIVND